MPPLFVPLASLGKRLFDKAAPVIREIPQETANLGKKVLSQGITGFSPTAPVPKTFKSAVSEGVSSRKQNLRQQFSYDREHPEQGIGATAANFAGGTAPQAIESAGAKAAPKIFKGFDDISTKLLEKLKGKSTVSRQYIEDMTNMPELKQAERDLVRGILKETKDTNISVPDFANKVKSELLPLKRGKGESSYENITLSGELRGPVANYASHVYESPISTSAGKHHFSAASGFREGGAPQNYFAHSRIEDLPAPDNATFAGPRPNAEPTRRVIEIQSDLFQKGRLEGEFASQTSRGNRSDTFELLPQHERDEYYNLLANKGDLKRAQELEEKARKLFDDKVAPDKARLEPYRNTWHERVIREEVKQAALDGKTKLQFPTGETAMKIEGLGETNNWLNASPRHTVDGRGIETGEVAYAGVGKLNSEDLEVGKTIKQSFNGDDWIITDVLGDGKFKAVPKDVLEKPPTGAGETRRQIDIDRATETFDISGKVDTENPIYRFYEKEVGRYLSKKYGAKRVTDAQGVEWYELDVSPEAKRIPIEAFGVAGLPFVSQDENKRRFKSTPVDRESLFIPK